MADRESPLWLPEGSVRSIIVLALVIGLIVSSAVAIYMEHEAAEPLVTTLIQATMVVLGIYFGFRGNATKERK